MEIFKIRKCCLLQKRQDDKHSPGPVTLRNSLALNREVHLATHSSALQRKKSENRGGIIKHPTYF